MWRPSKLGYFTTNRNRTFQTKTLPNTDTSSGGTAGECAAGSGDDTITLPLGIYTLAISGSGEDNNANGDLDVLTNISFGGAGVGATTINGGAIERVFDVRTGASASFDGLTITNGSSSQGAGIRINNGVLTITNSSISGNSSSSDGGAINARDNSTVTLTNSTVNNNTAGDDGGGIQLCCNAITVNITNSVLSNNQADVEGGALYHCCGAGSTISITDSTISGNSTVGPGSDGGGIYTCCGAETFDITSSVISGNSTLGFSGGGIQNEGSISIVNSTVSGNDAETDGGGIYSDGGGTLTIANSTITGNSATEGSGGGINSFGNATVRNSIVAGNFGSPNPDVTSDSPGDFISQGHNLIGDGTGSTEFTAAGDLVGSEASPIAPLLGLLADNGGPTFTHALLGGSPAIDMGNPATLGSGGTACEATDQRGAPRPGGSACDIGAYESNSLAPGTVPSLSQWALIGLAVALAGLGYLRSRRWRLPVSRLHSQGM